MATGERSLLQRTKALVEGLAREVAAQQVAQAQRQQQQQRQVDNPFAGESYSGQLVNVEANDRHFATEVRGERCWLELLAGAAGWSCWLELPVRLKVWKVQIL